MSNRTSGIRESGGRSELMLALWIALPSMGFLQEHVGTWVLPVYLAIVAAIMIFGWRWFPLPESWLQARFGWVAFACGVGLAVVHLGLHPFEDGRGPGFSSDRDEALEVAVGRMFDGEYPYYRKSEVAGPLSVLPGGILLSVPFVAMGKVGLMNVAWLVGFLFLIRREFGSAGRAMWLLAAPLAVSPAAQYEFVSAGDLIANSIYVTIGCWWCLRLWSEERLRPWQAVAAAVFLGVAVASRANYVLLCPLVVAWWWRRAGWHRALVAGTIVAVVSLGLIGGFYLADPDGFTPLLSRNKLAAGGTRDGTGSAILAATLLATAGFCLAIFVRRQAPDVRWFFRAATWLTVVPVLGVLLVASARHGGLDFSFLGDRFGLMFVPFALLGWGAATDGAQRSPG